jgi:hypothetical protein
MYKVAKSVKRKILTLKNLCKNMSTCITTLPACPNIQDQLVGDFSDFDYGRLREKAGFLEYIVSPDNTRDIVQNVSPGNGKLRTVELTYTPRVLETQVATNANKVCTSTQDFGAATTSYSLNPTTDGVSIDFRVTPLNLATICEPNEQWVSKVINYMIDAAVRKIHTQVATQLSALVGGFAVGDANQDGTAIAANTKVLSSKMASTLGYAPDYRFISELEFTAMNSGYGSAPLFFGWGEALKSFSQLRAACCADNGMNMGELASTSGMAFLADKKIGSVFGANYFVGLASGAVQLLQYNEYAGPRGINYIDTEIYKQTVIVDPQTGIAFDFTAKLDCGVWHFQIKKAFKLVGMPTDMFCVGDDYRGVTYVNKYQIVNP